MNLLRSLGFDPAIINEDVYARYRTKKETQTRVGEIRTLADSRRGMDPNDLPQTPTPKPEGEWDYHSYEYIIDNLKAMASSGIAHVSSIGLSVEGRDIWAIKISDNPTVEEEDEPESLVVAGVHAREWVIHEMAFHLARHLVERYLHDPKVRHIVDHSEVWIVPVANPDGYIYSKTTDRFWRKNRRDNGDGTFGVDLNRNFDFDWRRVGASSSTSSIGYAGPAPFSEPETQAIRDLALLREFDLYLDYHTAAQLILYPWGALDEPAPDKLLLSTLANRAAHQIHDFRNTWYETVQVGLTSNTWPPASGMTFDWFYAVFGIPALLIELPGPGFDPPQAAIRPAVEENIPAALSLLSWPIGFGDVENVTSGQHYRQILPAIADANEGDEIVVGPGLYPETLTIDGKYLTLRSIDPQDPCVVAATVIEGYDPNATLTLTGRHSRSTVIAGLTMIEGTLDIYNVGSPPIVENCTIRGSGTSAVQYYHGVEPFLIDTDIVGIVSEVQHPAIIAHWALDEADGTIALDSVQALQGVVSGDPVWQPEAGRVGGALQFDGIDDCVQTPRALNPSNPFSVYLWIKGGIPGQVLLSQAGSSNWLMIDTETGSLKTEIKANGRGAVHTLHSQANVSDDTWHRVGLTWDGLERRLYADGVIVASDRPVSGLRGSTNGLNIGCGEDLALGSFWSGLIDDIRIYNRVVTP